MRKLIAMIGLVAATASLPAAAAEWRQARTDHFILTIDASEQEARDFATRLERFDAALRKLYGVPDRVEERLRPLTIYAFKPELFMETCQCGGVAAYFSANAAGSYILSNRLKGADKEAKIGSMNSQELLLHEYTHYFTETNFPIAYPYWFQEGFAEFNSNVTFESDGSIIIGYPANYRGDAIRDSDDLPMKKLFDPDRYGYADDITRIYGRGWLLTHDLMLNPARAGQLAVYLSAMNQGMPSLEAAQKAFGDLKKLDAELDAYRKRPLYAPLKVPASGPVAVTVTLMPEGQAALLPTYAYMRDGVKWGRRLAMGITAEGVAKKYPEDALVQSQTAEIELAANRLDKADAAADRALALDPKSVPALVVKGWAAVLRAKRAKATDPAVWTAARAWYLKANRIDPNQVMPLFLYYTSFVAAKAKPTPGAIKALDRAIMLAPEAVAIRMAFARQEVLDGDPALARKLLQPIAFAPHAARDKNIPLQVLNLLDAGKVDEAKALLTKDDDKDDDKGD